MKLSTLLLAATVFTVPAVAFADGPKIGPNGGQRTDAGQYHAELVLTGNDVVLYLTDGANKPVDTSGAKAEATILASKQTQKVALEPAGANTLKGQAKLDDAHDSVKIVTAVTMPGQKTVQARFEMGHPGH